MNYKLLKKIIPSLPLREMLLELMQNNAQRSDVDVAAYIRAKRAEYQERGQDFAEQLATMDILRSYQTSPGEIRQILEQIEAGILK